MRLFYYNVTTNFGDHMNAWLWDAILPGLNGKRPDDVLVGIGSLIKSDLGKVPGRKVVFGTGSGYGPMPLPDEIAQWQVFCVRGPLTAGMLKLPESKAIIDGAWLVDLMPELAWSPNRRREGTVFVPHWTTDLYANWRQPCRNAGIRYVSPFGHGPAVFEAIASARLAIVVSLHGAIVADYYRVPWIPVATDGRVLAFKWLDFCLSLGLPYRPIRLPVTDSVERVLSRNAEPWSGGLEYLPEARVPDIANVPFAKQSPVTLRYRAMIQLKAVARPVRAAGFAVLNHARSLPPMTTTFASRSRQLADLLTSIEREPPMLSGDDVRREKLDRLRVAFADLKTCLG